MLNYVYYAWYKNYIIIHIYGFQRIRIYSCVHWILSHYVVMCECIILVSATYVSCTDCGNVTLLNGTVTTPEGTLYGATAYVSCDDGYVLTGDALLSCLPGPVWSDVPECIRGNFRIYI